MSDTIEITPEVTDAIVTEVSKSFEAKFNEQAAEFEKKLAEATKEADKEVSKIAGEDKEVEGEVVSKFAKLDKYEFAAEQFKAWVGGDHTKLSEMNAEAIKSYTSKDVEKATYMNVGTAADGGAIVPNRELLNDIFSVLGVYSQVAADLRTITLTEGTGIDYASLITDVVVTEVGTEGGSKPTTKPTFAKGNLDVREFAGIAIMTKKLVRQAAMSVYDILRDSFARAIATKRAELALTDSTSGIAVKSSGVNVVTTPATMTTVDKVTWGDLKRMIHKTPIAARQGAKFYISAALLEELDLKNDSQGRSLDLVKLDSDGMSGTFKDGSRFSVEAGLGVGSVPHAVYGAMGRYGILLRQGIVENETFDSGTVVDGSSVSHNLLQENKLAQRVAFYENVGFPLLNAFTVLKLASA